MRKRKYGSRSTPTENEANEDPIDEQERKYIYPSIANSPILLHNDQVIYAYGSSLIFYSLKEKKFVKKIDEHENAIRSLDVNKNGTKKYFLTTGDDKVIVIYDEQWSVCHKIVHKKKIVKAYFLKYVQEEDKKFEIIFIDKYGDVYLFDLKLVEQGTPTMGEAPTVGEASTTSLSCCTTKLSYLQDSLNDIQENDEDLFFMNNFERMLQGEEGEEENNEEEDKAEGGHSEGGHSVGGHSGGGHSGGDEGQSGKLAQVKEKLERHYAKCFQSETLMYPILACNSAVISLHYDSNFLIIGDRDEKIRIVKNKKINQIYNFYLNHKLFITSLVLINSKTFCSAAADCYLHMWDIKTKDIIDTLYFDSSFLCKLAEWKAPFGNSVHLKKYKFVINTLIFKESTWTIYATAENLKGILIIPLAISGDGSHLLTFNKEEISFFPLQQEVLSFIFLSLDGDDECILFVDRSAGQLHQIKLTDRGKLAGEVVTLDRHAFFDGAKQMDIGLINYWKHTTIEDEIP
ncbi:WD repeat-containing protein, putative [Plasmodium vivax]|uniref:WD repeat-containing protein, putative n=1 Tax=Plasmodium vivax TaxID=5855 RepID=A0A1G4H3V1_PLAVI|nr:WD repeat-containing protein, putative [Plasmodium vivax]VUZ98448.1 WD repeat-containing protein, putative [Plasmodium vivax]